MEKEIQKTFAKPQLKTIQGKRLQFDRRGNAISTNIVAAMELAMQKKVDKSKDHIID